MLNAARWNARLSRREKTCLAGAMATVSAMLPDRGSPSESAFRASRRGAKTDAKTSHVWDD